MNRAEWKQLLLVLLVGGVIRLGLALGVEWVLSSQPDRFFLVPGDAEGYWDLAGDLLTGADYEVYGRYVLRMPGFPAILAVARWLGHDQRLVVRLVLIAVSLAGIGGVYQLGRVLYSHAVGVLAATFVAISPILAGFGVLILSEGAFATALVWALVAMACWLKALELPGWSRAIVMGAMISGLFSTAAILMRPTWLACAGLIPAALVVCAIISAREHRLQLLLKSGLSAVVMGGTILLLLLPWALRNQSVSGKFTFTTLWVGASLYDGLHAGATGDSDMTFFETDGVANRLQEREVDEEYRRRAWAFVAQHPWRTVELAIIKQIRYWNLVPNYPEFRRWWILIPVGLSTAWLYAGICFELMRTPRHWRALLFCGMPVLVFAGIHLLFVGSMRYRLPAEFPMAVLAASGWIAVWNQYFGNKPANQPDCAPLAKSWQEETPC